MKTRYHVLSAALLASAALPAQDPEHVAQDDGAASPQVSFEARHGAFTIRQYQLGCLSLLSYLVVSGDEALVVDPQRDVERYLEDAAAMKAKIGRVLLTHHHADFVAGHTELAARTGAKILVARKAGAGYPHEPLEDGASFALGTATVRVWETPGHTPHSLTFLVDVEGVAPKPAYALTGDTLFVGSIGRPDLLDVPPAELAAQAHASLRRLATLPDATTILPAHGAGSLCGAHLSPETTSTIGHERATNPFLRERSRASFVAEVLSVQPVAPQYFRFDVELNRAGPPLVAREAEPPRTLAGAELARELAAGAWVVDLRDQRSYAKAHLAGSVNVALRGRLDTWTGIVVPFGQPLVLVGSDAETREGEFRLKRIGYDAPRGAVRPDPEAWRKLGLDVRTSKVVAPRELQAAIAAGKEPLVVDVRTREEHADLRIESGGNVPLTEWERLARTFAKGDPLLFACNSAYRSSMAVGLAERLGFTDVASLDGGLDAWLDAKLPVAGRQAVKAAPAAAPAGPLLLPEPIEPASLARGLMDQPQSYAIIDVRPAWQVAEWQIPGSKRLAPDAIVAHLKALPEAQRVVLVDRDGTTAFALAGALLARGEVRSVRVLVGGVARWYREIELEQRGGAAAVPAAVEPPGGKPPEKASETKAPVKRKAGC